MKKIFALIALAFLTCSCDGFFKKHFGNNSAIILSEEFVQGSEDVPLLVGMARISDDSLGFDSNSGSIISSSYTINNHQKEVRNFYLKTLPQMGWQIVKNLETKVTFKRDRENLEIEFLQENGSNILRFFISSTL